MEFAARNMKITLPPDHAVDAEIDLGPEGGAFSLAARLYVSLPGMERAAAQRLVEAAHQVCPYSRATHGNIAVETTLVLGPPMRADSDRLTSVHMDSR
jgi:organic hydroperoxide reductase OsmC/OhrA